MNATQDDHNRQQTEKAVELLRKLIDQALKTDAPGLIGLRIPIMRKKLGNIHPRDRTVSTT